MSLAAPRGRICMRITVYDLISPADTAIVLDPRSAGGEIAR
jgi:hypothetical protein